MSQATMEVLGRDGEWTSVKVSCPHCPYTLFTHRLTEFMPPPDDMLAEHLSQHKPGRALDIEVDWEPSAICSVCEDGIGLIGWDEDGEGVKCKECGTTWSLDGTGGERLS